MLHLMFIVIFAVLVLGGFAYVYFTYIAKNMTTVAVATSKTSTVAATSGVSKVVATVEGWKTLVCTWIATVAGFFMAIPSDVIQGWANLPFAQIVDQKVAAVITIVFSLLAGLFHSQGLAKAATTVPAPTDTSTS